MTRLIDLSTLAAFVHERGAARCMTELAAELRSDFLRWESFDKSARTASHSPRGVIELMPVADDALYSFKYVNGHPGNPASGLPTVMAFGVLAEVRTGYPLLLSELTLTTALRTAATSALAAQALARPGSRRMALIGNGAQAEFQALAFHALLGIRELRVYDTDPAATDKLVRNLAHVDGLTVERAASTAEAVRGADIVTTVTADKSRATILTPAMVEPGMHLNAVGGDCPGKTELHPDVLRGARVVVEYEPQSRVEGEIQQLPADHPVTELWRVLRGDAPGRTRADEVTVFDSVGFALEDYSALRYLYQQAQARGLGVDVELVPTDDPKDLFGRTRGASVQGRTRLRRVA
ncbi:ornithine cyclodeaminase [Diaphorobacter sp. JS3050]|uniref:ornithine cyclodeaminase n=1 Tax=unclassified Diaphorobacter TaxID=2649760 RepID=UPI0015536706|nr:MULTISPECIES: ornithine cyclodeaminase [unclassified Diaphorobacter]QJY32290.1 ornithine cyclodeaminase [Diaphorobacter sp. JS3050]QPN32858.1 ornithine cyclodeaminase [Diaphorobacter sp. JS3051]